MLQHPLAHRVHWSHAFLHVSHLLLPGSDRDRSLASYPVWRGEAFDADSFSTGKAACRCPRGEKSTAAASKPAPATPAAPEKVKIYWTDELMHKEVKYYNPEYAGDGQFQIENGEPVAVVLANTKVTNLKALEGKKLMALDLSGTAVSDLSPLKGMPLVELYLERTKVVDLYPLKGMPIKKLYLSGTPVRDIAPLQGMPLTDLNAIDTQIVDISPLAKSPIAMLWLTNCPVESIAPLHSIPLVSVTLKGTKVRDLTPLSGTQLQRLHIAETPVEDLSPLKDIPLTRLVFTPANIKQGLDVAKALPLAQIGTRFEEDGNDLLPPAQFWAGQGK
ncbi:leucine-rich repeat domain-containing protein [Roseimicrobium sp. ORNL1]|uniref:leucine-rich repeat domain-containing protein n=1 Tax=Roseimicrobium sp. ORNL1 TaxID=2711231 RepID=UPI0013E17B10|nr:leucine-rich repeat domain-containing protein [Roseimicrobium sp. ORNL1]QIF04159.1 leucine-rich repeat domain-containing protein [Roseimicrobium sp. ORNL1]